MYVQKWDKTGILQRSHRPIQLDMWVAWVGTSENAPKGEYNMET